MTIEIHRPELELLIHERMASGASKNVEDVLMHAMIIAATSESSKEATGAGLVAAMQASPLKDIDLEPERYPRPVRDGRF